MIPRRRLAAAGLAAVLAVPVGGQVATPAEGALLKLGPINLFPRRPGIETLPGVGTIVAPVTTTLDQTVGTVTQTVTGTVGAATDTVTGTDTAAGTTETLGTAVGTVTGAAGTTPVAAAADAPVLTEPAPQGAPIAGAQVSVDQVRGTVHVRTPAGWQPLQPGSAVPVGALLDTRKGAVQIAAAGGADGQHAAITGGIVSVAQSASGDPMTTIALRGGDFDACAAAADTSVARRWSAGRVLAIAAGTPASRRKVRKIWVTAKGRFRTEGRFATATVRGTTWMTEDRCDGTTVRVKEGVVDVGRPDGTDVRPVHAGEARFVARAGAAKRRQAASG